MNRRLLLGTFVLAWVLFSFNGFSQGNMEIALKQFDLEAYQLAIDNFQKVLQEDPENEEALYKLAEAYRLSNQNLEAISLYEKMVSKKNCREEAYLYYGHLLKTTGNYDEAKAYFEKYATAQQDVGNHFAQSCSFAKDLLAKDLDFNIKTFPYNSASSDFGVSFVEDQLVFSSFRKDIQSGDEARNRSIIRIQGNQLFKVPLDMAYDSKGNVVFLRERFKNSYHNGPVHFSNTKTNMVAVTKNNIKDGFKHVRNDDTHMSLFIATKKDKCDYTEERPFPYNETGYSTGFAHFTEDGTKMYFASNRPGGYGGYDLYVSYLIKDKWSIPVNLGSEVNSSGNEITPYFDESENKLYFASDFHLGLGGFDIFSVDKTGELSYSGLKNLGNGINSPEDDYYLSIEPESGQFFFSSNRLGGQGHDDIYYATKIEKEEDAQIAEAEVIPESISLQNLEQKNSEVAEANLVSINESASDSYFADNFFSLSNARMIAKHDVILAAPPSKVYFVQVAALYKSSSNVAGFNELTALGNLYKVYKTNSTKIRVGYYFDKAEADKILSMVRNMGYQDAFIVHEPLRTSELELLGNAVDGDPSSISSTFRSAPKVSNYKIRLASYTDPLWFDISRVNDLGEIEQWTKGQYTIFILSGYGSLDNAQKAMIKAQNRGFTEAHIVVDNDGFLEKLKEN